jgi:O-antigen ligase
LWQYGLLLLVPLLAAGCRPESARRALQHFVLASAAVGLVFVLGRLDSLPPLPMVWHTTLEAEGNQRIAASILLAMGVGLGAWLALDARGPAGWAWLGAAAICLLALTLQDRRTGMLLLPTLLLVWGVMRQPAWWRRLLVAALVVGAGAATWQASEGVQARFTEGMAELRHYPGDDTVATSWGQRLRMWERTGDLVAERPWAGHGIGSWRGLWQQRVTPGTALAEHSTPHNEYLLLAQQGGAVAVGLWLWLLVAAWRQAAAAGSAGVPALMAWTALAWVGLFNAVLRDAKFALPLLLLAALGSAMVWSGRPHTALSDGGTDRRQAG